VPISHVRLIAGNGVIVQDGDAGYGAYAGAVTISRIMMDDAVFDVSTRLFAADPAASASASGTGVVIPGEFRAADVGIIAAQEEQSAAIAAGSAQLYR